MELIIDIGNSSAKIAVFDGENIVYRSTCRNDFLSPIDEILKGTNTKERIAASKAILEYFSKQHCMLMVATHDLELAKAFDKTYDNYHFAEVIGTQDVRFDYELHKGISNSSNAIKLLSAIGFPKQIIDMAQSEAEKDTV